MSTGPSLADLYDKLVLFPMQLIRQKDSIYA